jgi:DNA polymerase-1
VGSYAEQDANLTLKLWQHFKPLIRKEELESVFNLETDLLPVLIDLTFRGIRFDRVKCEQLMDQFKKREKEINKELKRIVGKDVEVWAADSIAKAFDVPSLTSRQRRAPQALLRTSWTT